MPDYLTYEQIDRLKNTFHKLEYKLPQFFHAIRVSIPVGRPNYLHRTQAASLLHPASQHGLANNRRRCL